MVRRSRLTRLTRLAVWAALFLALSVPATAQDRVIGSGGWSWFSDPRALHYAGRSFAGWVDPGGRVVVASYDGRGARTVTVGLFEHVDDHDNPTLFVRADRRVMVFFAHHAEDHIHYRVSARPLDISAWGPELSVPTRRVGRWGNTYPNPIRLPGDGLSLFWRGSDWSTFFSVQRRGGGWARPRRLIRYGHRRPYAKYAHRGATIHMAFSRTHPREGLTGIYYVKLRHGVLYRASGRRIRRLGRKPLRPREADHVYVPPSPHADGWVHDIALDRRGRPVIVYAVVHSRRRHSYRYARWTGRRWRDRYMTSAGGSISTTPREWAYSGGITLDKRDPSVAYLSRRVGRLQRLERWRTPNGGRRWRRQLLTSGSAPAYRPVVPAGMARGEPEELLWLQGDYGSYRTFHTLVNLHSSAPAAPAVVSVRDHGRSRSVALRASVLAVGVRPPVSLEWQFGDGRAAYGPAVRHRYARPGNYFPRLSLRDAAGREFVYVRELRVR